MHKATTKFGCSNKYQSDYKPINTNILFAVKYALCKPFIYRKKDFNSDIDFIHLTPAASANNLLE